MTTINKTLESIIEKNKIDMVQPPREKAEYLQDLRNTARRFYQLLQYLDGPTFEEARYYECTGEINNPKDVLLPKDGGCPLLGFNVIIAFKIGEKIKEKGQVFELFHSEDAWWLK